LWKSWKKAFEVLEGLGVQVELLVAIHACWNNPKAIGTDDVMARIMLLNSTRQNIDFILLV
jgi:hypothetical protein